MTRRAARRRRWKLAIVGIAIAGGLVAWWVRSGGSLPPLQAQSEAPPSPVTLPAPSVATTSVVTTPPAPVAAPPQVADLEAEQARDAEWAVARRESIRVQQRLREEAAEQRVRTEALETGDEMRCIEGRRMRRVSNGWVDAGTC